MEIKKTSEVVVGTEEADGAAGLGDVALGSGLEMGTPAAGLAMDAPAARGGLDNGLTGGGADLGAGAGCVGRGEAGLIGVLGAGALAR